MKSQNTKTKSEKLPLRREFSAGGVVYRKFKVRSSKLKVKWLIGKHSGYHKWVLPKGLIEKGERGFEAAVREVEEEMGVRANLISKKPICKEEYWFVAEYKQRTIGDNKQEIRRVAVYQENSEIEKSEKKFRVFKTVSFYLMEYKSGDPKDHDWEMSEVGWFSFDEAESKLAFSDEKKALKKANDIISHK